MCSEQILFPTTNKRHHAPPEANTSHNQKSTMSHISLLHDHSNMIIHILVDIAKEDARQDGNASESNTRQVHVLITFCIRNLACQHDHLVRRFVSSDAGDLLDAFEQTRRRELNRLSDVCGVCDAKLQGHGAANVLGCVGHELVHEHIVVNRVPDTTANDADGQGQCGDRGDNVIGTDNRGHDRSGDDDATNTQATEDE
ncbi:hypothetical protein PV05_05872 [Exophiala xenobiotica]|uniref:Uncharacterized protein n=1 Tax=Exophiala xenobiotica TaxID=348802 RepID=A0A0D2EP69_9EURO|nr:uncharacterized protein PV05_05872 [Exophiala xenobiotica]KIW57303.1 hypothetical protein PV05_05872 [Exophiala xenobiotica]